MSTGSEDTKRSTYATIQRESARDENIMQKHRKRQISALKKTREAADATSR